MQSLDDYPELLTVQEYAAITRQGLTKAYDDVRLGRIQSLRLGRTLRIPRRAIESLINDGEADADRTPRLKTARLKRPAGASR